MSFVNIPTYNWQSPVLTSAELPTGGQPGDARVALDTSHIWVLDSSYTWKDVVNGSSTNSFSIMQTPNGTYPTATSPSDVLTFTSLDNSVTITGNSTTDTIDFKLNSSAIVNSFNGRTGAVTPQFSDYSSFYEAPLTFSGPLNRAVNTISIPAATSSVNGYLTSTDWNTFNSKQSAGNYITALTGDATASGPGSAAITLATVNSNIGSFNTVTVNAKGLVTAASNTSYEVPLTFSTGLTRSTNTITANLSTGVSGGQSVIGGTAASNSLTLSSTSNATKGKLLFGSSAYDEASNKLGINNTSPFYTFTIGSPSTGLTALNTTGAMSITASTGAALYIESTAAQSSTGGGVISVYANPSTTILNGSRLGVVLFGGNISSTTTGNVATIEAFSGENWTAGSALGSILTFNTITNGTTSRAERARIHSNGFLGVSTNAPAYTIDASNTGTVNALRYRSNTQTFAFLNASPTITAPTGATNGVLELGFAGAATNSFSARISANNSAFLELWNNTGVPYANFYGTQVGINLPANTSPPAGIKLHISQDATTVSSTFYNTSTDAFLLSGTNVSTGFTFAVADNTNAGSRGVFKGARSRGTLATPLAVQSGDSVFSVLSAPHDGTQGTATAGIEFIVDGAVSTGVLPQRIVFGTSATNTRTERMRIDQNGLVGINTLATPVARLDVLDTTLASSGSLSGSILNLAQTWNTTGIPTAVKLNVTNTASNVASKLLDLQVSSTSKFNIDKFGAINSSTNSIIFGSGETSTPVATTIRGAAAGGSNVGGADLTFQASNGTGTQASGSIIMQAAPGTAGTSIGTNTKSTAGSTVNTFTVSHTVTAGSNRMLVVMVEFGSFTTVTSVTYGGVSLTKQGGITSTSTNGDIWYLLSPTPGTANVVVNYAGFTNTVVDAINMTGVNQSTPFRTASSTSGFVSSASLTPTSSIGDIVLDLVVTQQATATITGGQTLIFNGNDTTTRYVSGSYKAGAASTTTVSYSFSVSDNIGYYAVAVQSAGGSGSNTMQEIARVAPTGFGVGGVSSPTAVADILGSITTKASLRIRSGTAPTSPNDGDLWNDSTQKVQYMNMAGVNQAMVGNIFTQTADATVSNTITETSIISTGIGTKTLPSNFFVPGKTYRIRLRGYLSSTGTPTINVKHKLNSITLIQTGVQTINNTSNGYFIVDAVVTCRTTGVSGTLSPVGTFDYETTGAGHVSGTYGMVSTSPVTIDTTASQTIDTTVTWGTASAGNVITGQTCAIEVLN